MSFDKVIRGGQLVTAVDTVKADIGIQGEQIAAIGQALEGRQVIDAHGKLVIPGAIDPHVHLQMPAGTTTSSDDWESGTIAAACGGTTTIISFVEPDDSLMAGLEQRLAQTTPAVIDFGLHMTLNRLDAYPERLQDVPAVVEAGITSFKVYTAYEGMKLIDSELLDAMTAVRDAGGLVMAHCENDAICTYTTRQLLNRGYTTPSHYPLSRPDRAEVVAIQSVLALAETANVPVYIVHISTMRGAEAVAHARENNRIAPVYGETCPQYLILTDEEYNRPGFEGAKFVCAPPLRGHTDRAKLWAALQHNGLQTIATDHCPFNYKGQKDFGRHSFVDIPGGLPGVEARLALVYTQGVSARRLSANRWVETCCTAPARIFGLYPRKGTIAPGSDADIVIFDPDKIVTLSAGTLHENVDYTPYEGFQMQGYPVMTLSRGKIIFQDGQFCGRTGAGQYLHRTHSLQ